MGSTCAPFCPMTCATRTRASCSTMKITHPPPPAPQTLAARAPCRPATAISLSINGAVIPIDVEVDSTDSAIESGIVILTPGGHVDDLRFDVLGDHPHLLPGKHAAGEAGQSSGGSDHQGRGAGDARAGRRLRIGFDQ